MSRAREREKECMCFNRCYPDLMSTGERNGFFLCFWHFIWENAGCCARYVYMEDKLRMLLDCKIHYNIRCIANDTVAVSQFPSALIELLTKRWWYWYLDNRSTKTAPLLLQSECDMRSGSGSGKLDPVHKNLFRLVDVSIWLEWSGGIWKLSRRLFVYIYMYIYMRVSPTIKEKMTPKMMNVPFLFLLSALRSPLSASLCSSLYRRFHFPFFCFLYINMRGKGRRE